MADEFVHVKVTIPRELTSTNLTYGLVVTTNNQFYSKPEFVVSRQFSDFKWLALRLDRQLPFPNDLRQLPESFIELEEQRAGLEAFFKKAANESTIYRRNLIHFFLDDQRFPTLIQADLDRAPPSQARSHEARPTTSSSPRLRHETGSGSQHSRETSSSATIVQYAGPRHAYESPQRVQYRASRPKSISRHDSHSYPRVISPSPSVSASSDASSKTRVRFRHRDSADDVSTGTENSRQNAYDSLKMEKAIAEEVRTTWRQQPERGLKYHPAAGRSSSNNDSSRPATNGSANGHRASQSSAHNPPAAEATAYWLPLPRSMDSRQRASETPSPRSRGFEGGKPASKGHSSRHGSRSNSRRSDTHRQSPSHAFDQLSLQSRATKQDGWTELSASMISQGSQGPDNS
eukprot:TRINITY_DN6233_c0_g1_i2.p1 TRINITY_DN6233_c0_g1~~TRINITY_DN6233_c0_g1_i2.p1  ORF type:complete len:403 (+),score=31.70 TRINITY_DN6233_c0_g1_i2:56-1264(+)